MSRGPKTAAQRRKLPKHLRSAPKNYAEHVDGSRAKYLAKKADRARRKAKR